jgi:Glutathione S-transferase, N-terminal domain
MLLTHNRFAAFTRRGFQSALFSALLAPNEVVRKRRLTANAGRGECRLIVGITMIQLYQFPFSHFCEKARWALDYKSIAYGLSTFCQASI